MTGSSPDDEISNTELAPRRLLDGGGVEHARRLIASAQFDRAPSGAKARVEAALGGVFELHAAPSAAPSEPEPATRGARRSPSGTGWGLGVAGVGIVGAIALSLWLPAPPGESSRAGSTAGASVSESNAAWPAPALAVTPSATSSPAQTALVAGAEKPAPAPSAQVAQHAELALGVPSPPDQAGREHLEKEAVAVRVEPAGSGLLAEVRALEAVSSAIDTGHPDRAERELDAYRRRFARGQLAIEADVLAVQIAVARGDDSGARARAARLLARPEADRYRARVSSLLEGQRQPSGPSSRENAGSSRSNDAAAHMRARR